MEILNQLYKKAQPKKIIEKNEYTDLSDIQMMMKCTQRRQGLGFDDFRQQSKKPQNFIKKLKKEQIVEKKEKEIKEKNKEKEDLLQKREIKEKQIVKTIYKKKQFQII